MGQRIAKSNAIDNNISANGTTNYAEKKNYGKKPLTTLLNRKQGWKKRGGKGEKFVIDLKNINRG